MIKTVVIGAAGRMGKHLVTNILAADDMELVGATEYSGCPLLGADAGTVAGLPPCGIKISEDLSVLLDNADGIINFSTGPVVEHTQLAVQKGCCAVIGTTALSDDEVNQLKTLSEQGGKIVFAPNMSIGVNLLFHLSAKVASILGNDYDIEIVEMHHNKKKDAPSGTAARLGNILAEARELSYEQHIKHGRQGIVGEREKNEIGMHALRGGDVVGEHTVIFATNGERVELGHKASSRDTFAKGALRAMRYLQDKSPGLYDMQDVLGLKQ